MTTTMTRLATAGASLVLSAGSLAVGTSTAAAAPSAPSCDAGQRTVTSVVTAQSAASICQWRTDGTLEYRGVARSSGNALCIPVSEVHRQENGSGRYYYVAYNNGYKYSVFDGLGLSIVGPDGLLISSEDAIG
ncbi:MULTISPECIES: hypothetical protein [unclassified Gordonia (in: high G+C Gram-positive bacteria)]|uniref:hypothetical protein n=1 Tax=unclassified Gordonia (in: high G+C Gram-positive bacteria) TaxID=2657482 RepID=UPI00071DBC33|nr:MULTISPECIES: hypothetical protein [unclassified Gordonia (in: high G+C Gram-positive bacteria)]KSU61326.1 hypothetical protein AS181_01740 [Gordonia sp. SGD-V-85]SCB79213.1 hypothetical protein GA0061091_101354 [Gordonia sp. v-85]